MAIASEELSILPCFPCMLLHGFPGRGYLKFYPGKICFFLVLQTLYFDAARFCGGSGRIRKDKYGILFSEQKKPVCIAGLLATITLDQLENGLPYSNAGKKVGRFGVDGQLQTETQPEAAFGNDVPMSLYAKSMSSLGYEITYCGGEEVSDNRVTPGRYAFRVTHFPVLVEAVTQLERKREYFYLNCAKIRLCNAHGSISRQLGAPSIRMIARLSSERQHDFLLAMFFWFDCSDPLNLVRGVNNEDTNQLAI